MDWSHHLPDADEVPLFRRLAVFAGGFALNAIEAVHGPDALAPLMRLTDKSLVVVERRGRVQRYRTPETVRQYAEEKLVDSGEVAAVRDRHHDWYLAATEEASSGIRGPRQVEWVERLEIEFVERASNMIAPLALLYVRGRPVGLPGLRSSGGRHVAWHAVQQADPVTVRRIVGNFVT